MARVKGDQAGRAIMEAMTVAVLAAGHIQVRAGARLTGLLQDAAGRIRGVAARIGGEPVEITARAVILATGGIGGLYAVTTTPAELQGDGLGLAALAGAVIADPEFVQFHPTAIDIGRDPAPLATEALRGEGAVLVNSAGERFMDSYHPAAELAPRDVVARAIHAEREAGRGAFLDAREAVGGHFPDEFPAVFAACMGGGIDPRTQAIPVAPACHYHMGGIATDAEGCTSLPGLFAAGECASTGVHGANRLASNSLLEAAVFGTRAGRAAALEGPAPAPSAAVTAADLPPAALHWSLWGVPERLENDATQETYWELRKFLILALKANPNILECLYSPLVETVTPLAAELIAMRESFLSRLVYQTYNGYVMSQFKKLEPEFELIRNAEAPRVVPIGKLKVAEAPNDADFEKAAVWKIKIPKDPEAAKTDYLLRIKYLGDAARIEIQLAAQRARKAGVVALFLVEPDGGLQRPICAGQMRKDSGDNTRNSGECHRQGEAHDEFDHDQNQCNTNEEDQHEPNQRHHH